jgi:hypothetical protein
MKCTRLLPVKYDMLVYSETFLLQIKNHDKKYRLVIHKPVHSHLSSNVPYICTIHLCMLASDHEKHVSNALYCDFMMATRSLGSRSFSVPL